MKKQITRWGSEYEAQPVFLMTGGFCWDDAQNKGRNPSSFQIPYFPKKKTTLGALTCFPSSILMPISNVLAWISCHGNIKSCLKFTFHQLKPMKIFSLNTENLKTFSSFLPTTNSTKLFHLKKHNHPKQNSISKNTKITIFTQNLQEAFWGEIHQQHYKEGK